MKVCCGLLAGLFFVVPVQAQYGGEGSGGHAGLDAAGDKVETLLAFLPPPPPLPGMSKDQYPDSPRHPDISRDRHPEPGPRPGVSSPREQDIIDRYYGYHEREGRYYRDGDRRGDSHHDRYEKEKKKKKLPHGIQKKQSHGKGLPPGWQKKIARGEVLDHDLRRHIVDLPHDLRRDLPRPPRGTRYVRLEDKILRIVESTFEIIDIFTVRK